MTKQRLGIMTASERGQRIDRRSSALPEQTHNDRVE